MSHQTLGKPRRKWRFQWEKHGKTWEKTWEKHGQSHIIWSFYAKLLSLSDPHHEVLL